MSIVGLLTLSLQSCFFSEDDIFEESSNQRIESALSEYQTLLTGASNGWKLEYYPGGENHDIGGVVLLLRFEGENVTIMSDKSVKGMDDPDSIRAGEQVTSKFSLLADQSTVLSFLTGRNLKAFLTQMDTKVISSSSLLRPHKMTLRLKAKNTVL